jgi:hypothetical protein
MRLQLPSPPRPVPLSRRLNFFLSGATLAGAFFFAFGMALLWGMLILTATLEEWALNRRAELARGVVYSVLDEGRAYRQPGSGGPHRYRCGFTFSLPDGTQGEGRSFIVGSALTEGQQVHIEYLPDHPQIARVRGTSYSSTGELPVLGVLFVALFPLLGIAFVVGRAIKTCLWARRFKSLEATDARVEQGERIAVMGEKHVVRYRVSYTTPTGSSLATMFKAYEVPDVSAGGEMTILYDPARPERAMAAYSLWEVFGSDERPLGALHFANLKRLFWLFLCFGGPIGFSVWRVWQFRH